jgi:murein DD-endopeptidase MepM/ murein hydrolase activator NlpD
VITLFAALTLAAALGPIVWLLRTRAVGPHHWLVASTAAAAVSGSALLAGSWTLLSVYLRPLIATALIVALVTTNRAARRAAARDQSSVSRHPSVRQVVVACIFAVVFMNGLAGRFTPQGATELRFPLIGGVFGVLQGGGSLVLNPFHRWFASDKYALDLVKLNALGNRGRGISPGQLTDYASFNVPVHSPCTGTIEEVERDVPDNAPGYTDPQHPAGNYVLLRCGALRVRLGHFARGSLAVSPDDAVEVGQVLGRIGNSGNTAEPHLHLGAMRVAPGRAWPEAEAAPVTFNGRFLTINDIVR